MQWEFRRVAVTGGAGFLGSHLCEQLVARGTSVLCLDNLSTGSARNLESLAEEPTFELVEHDIARRPYTAGGIDLVVHLASPASPADYLRMPVETLRVGSRGTEHALELADRNGARFLLVSTSEVYGDPLRHPQTEDYWGNVNPVGPRAVYDEAKRYAEALTTAFRASRGTGTRIARVFNTYGPRMRPADGRVVPTFIRQALAGEPITVNGDGRQTRSLCYVDDTVRGLLAVAAANRPQPVNIGRPGELPVRKLAELVRSLVGSRSPIEHVAASADDPKRRCPDITVATRELGWRPRVDVVAGLRHTIAWFTAEARAAGAAR
ncbi:NAD-dependent epimerase/dehydratase family protein [Saccharopolyspora thermophila]|uniref:NAD-dependent epimerase/dehydratase family protein n=1 Tax=Saccharopolyspora thermophila TaxID=89367 RepID=UPI001E352708|nr:NAD-dependent epimerase/dehydratase family protein [Saccharopolyspora subtropica]